VIGANIAAMVSLVADGSIAQDVSVGGVGGVGGVNVPSVSCFAHVSSLTGATGSLAIWNLNQNIVSSVPFTATADWQLVVNTLDIGGQATVRVEFYLTQAGGELSIDDVNLF
jgi:hypothetical protein